MRKKTQTRSEILQRAIERQVSEEIKQRKKAKRARESQLSQIGDSLERMVKGELTDIQNDISQALRLLPSVTKPGPGKDKAKQELMKAKQAASQLESAIHNAAFQLRRLD